MTSPTLPELDALVAARVMGWKRSETGFDLDGNNFWIHHERGVMVQEQGNHVRIFSPTTKDADAFAVLARVCESLAVIIVEVGGRWTVAQVTGQRLKVESPTLRESICRFALRFHE